MTQVFYASTLFGAMTLAAALDAGTFGPREGRRVLVVSTNAGIPEIGSPLDATPGFAALRSRFDDVHSWNAVIAPLHPSDWKARVIEVPMMGRLLSSYLSLDGPPSELVVESVAVPPARTIAGLLRECPITVYSDGLMSYGPTRDPLPLEISGRLTRLLHLDLVPGLDPLLLTEYGVPAQALPGEAFTAVLGEVAREYPDELEGDAVILGQYLSALGIVTPAEEAGLHADMLRALVARGHRQVVFKPHPAAGRRHAQQLRETADELGVRLAVAGESTPAEVCFARLRPALVVGCFSTALATADRLFGLPVATMGGDMVLERLTPYENSNRIPATIVDATVPRLLPDGSLEQPEAAGRLTELVKAVGYCMQSAAHPGLREAAAAYVAEHGPARHFKRQRLGALDLLPPADPRPDDAAPPGAISRLRRKLARTLS